MMSSNPRSGREETAAVLVAIALVSIGAGFWLSNDTPPATCCPPTVRSLGAANPEASHGGRAARCVREVSRCVELRAGDDVPAARSARDTA